MSNILAGFVKGFADTTRGGLERREEEERELRKAKLLNELRMATEKEMTIFKESTPAAMEDREYKRKTDMRGDRQLDLQEEQFRVGGERWQKEFDQRTSYQNRQLSLSERAVSRGRESDDILLAEANRAWNSLEAADVNKYQISQAQRYFDAMVNGIDPVTGQDRPPATKEEQRKYLQAVRRNLLKDVKASLDVIPPK